MRKLIITAIIIFVTSISFSQKNEQLSIQTWTFHKYSLLETIDKSDSLGIRNLEVYPGQKVGGNIPGVFSYTLDKTSRDEIKGYLRNKNIKVIALGVVDKYYYTKENLEQFFLFCKDMGIPFLTAEPETADLDLFNQLAGKYKIKVGLHCHPKPSSHYWHPDSTMKAMQGRKNIGAWPDIGNWARNGVNGVEGLKKMKGKLWGIHLKEVVDFDNTATPDILFGKGICDIPAVLKELKRQHFKGPISIEYEANENNNMEDMRKNKLFYEQEIRKIK